MIECIALRFFRLSGATFAKGDTVWLPEGQFADLSSVGLVERSPEIAVTPAMPPRKRGFLNGGKSK